MMNMDTETSLALSNKKKRKRAHYACVECYRRKQKCSRDFPCKQCIERNNPQLCRPFDNEAEEEENIKQRLSRVEKVLATLLSKNEQDEKPNTLLDVPLNPARQQQQRRDEHAVAHLLTHISSENEGSPSRIDDGNTTLTEDVGSGDADGSWFGSNALPSVNSALLQKIGAQELSSPLFPSIDSSQSSQREEIYAQLTRLCQIIPPRASTDSFVDSYFRHINWVRQPVHEISFRTSYDRFMLAFSARTLPANPHIIPLLLMILCAAIDRDQNPNKDKTLPSRLYQSYRKSFFLLSELQPDHFDHIQAALIAYRMLVTRRRIRDAWQILGMSIRSAYALGLHRDPTRTRTDLSRVAIEQRRRLWSNLLWLDQSSALLLGRPSAIDLSYVDVLPPCPISDESLATSYHSPSWNPPSPEETFSFSSSFPPTIYHFVCLRHSLALIMAKITRHFHAHPGQPRNYKELLEIDDLLVQYRHSLPSIFQMDNNANVIDRSWDDSCNFLPLHRYLINIELHYVRIALHRPYLLLDTDEKYIASKLAGLETAQWDLAIRRAVEERGPGWPKEKVDAGIGGGVHRMFNTMLVIALALIADPKREGNEGLRSSLDKFLKDRREHLLAADSTSQREVAIIELLRMKGDPGPQTFSPTISFDRTGPSQGEIAEDRHESSPFLLENNSNSNNNREKTLNDDPGGADVSSFLFPNYQSDLSVMQPFTDDTDAFLRELGGLAADREQYSDVFNFGDWRAWAKSSSR